MKDLDRMITETEWYPERLFLLWIVKRRLWSSFVGSAYQMHEYKNGVCRKFWTRKEAQARAELLNAQTGGSDNDR